MKIIVHSTDRADGRMSRAIVEAAKQLEDTEPIHATVHVVLGDRLEMLTAAALLRSKGEKIIHVAGGETAPFSRNLGSPDHWYRNAITMLSDFHFVANPYAAQNLQRMYVPIENVYITGLPGLSRVYDAAAYVDPAAARVGVAAHWQPCPYHTDGQFEHELNLFKRLLDAAARVAPPVTLSLPNRKDRYGDRAHTALLAAYEQQATFRCYTSGAYRGMAWLDHLATSKLLIGNSSSFRIEASIFNTPVLEIGNRQAARLVPENIRQVREGAASTDAEAEALVRLTLRDIQGATGESPWARAGQREHALLSALRNVCKKVANAST